jgi:hypothetical protein
LPAGDELAVGDLGLLGECPLAPADLLEGIGGRGALAPAPGGMPARSCSARSFLPVSEGRWKA